MYRAEILLPWHSCTLENMNTIEALQESILLCFPVQVLTFTGQIGVEISAVMNSVLCVYYSYYVAFTDKDHYFLLICNTLSPHI